MNIKYNKYNLDPNVVKCGGCSKPAQLRRGDGKVVSAYRGRNNEELCHKCASCYHCGKKEKWDVYRKNGGKWEVEEDYGMPSHHLVDNDNPSGGWDIAFCLDCRAKRGFETFRYYDDREYWKVDGVMFNPQAKREWYNFENYKRAYEKAQDYWNSLSSSEREREGERLIENMKLGKYLGGLRGKEGEMFGWVPNNSWWRIENGKLVSDNPQLVPCLMAEEFLKKMFGDINWCRELVLRDYKIVKKDNNDNQDNSPKSNPAASTPQPITNSNDKNDNSVGSVNAPPSSSEPKNSSEIKISPKPVGESKDNPREKLQNETEKGNNQTPVINLKDIKKISLVGDNLVIEFNQSEKRQTVVSEQITNNQELSAVKNYLRKNNQTSLSQQELNKIFSKENNRVASTKKSPELNNALLIGGGVVVLIIGVGIGLFLRKSKKTLKK